MGGNHYSPAFRCFAVVGIFQRVEKRHTTALRKTLPYSHENWVTTLQTLAVVSFVWQHSLHSEPQ